MPKKRPDPASTPVSSRTEPVRLERHSDSVGGPSRIRVWGASMGSAGRYESAPTGA
jgi:hypothetical protein